jgi:Bacterial SH3 domain
MSKDSVLWFGVTKWYFYDQKLDSFYIVLSNENKGFAISYFNRYFKTLDIIFKDINNDGNDEIIITSLLESFSSGECFSFLNIYGFLNNNFKEIFKTVTFNYGQMEMFANYVSIFPNLITLDNINFDLNNKIYFTDNNKNDFIIPLSKEKIYYKFDSDKFTYIQENKTENQKLYAKTTVNDLRIRNKPSFDSKVLTVLNKDEKVEVNGINFFVIHYNGIQGQWIKVINKNKIEGYVFSNYLEFDDNFIDFYFKPQLNSVYESLEKNIFFNIK